MHLSLGPSSFPATRRTAQGDQGATLIVFALSLLAIFAVIALVLGGSLGYTAERNSQTASDAAALAAARVLRDVQTASVTDAALVGSTAVEVADENGLDGSIITCEVVRLDRSAIGPCGVEANVRHAEAAGVRVSTSDERDVPFGEPSGNTSISASTVATAAIQPLRAGRSPVMLCSRGDQGGEGHPIEVLIPGTNDINPDAIGQYFMLWSNGNDLGNGERRCDLGPDWKGWLDTEDEFTLPGPVEKNNGSATGQRIPRFLIGGCDIPDDTKNSNVDVLDGCVVAVPLCTRRLDKDHLYCETFGAFRLHVVEGSTEKPCFRGSDDKKKAICGELLGDGGIAVGGEGGDDLATAGEVVVIKLVE